MAEMTTDFDKFAVEYDFWMQTVQQPSNYQQIRDLLPRPGSHVLELGCGAGRLALFLADACQQVTGIDSSATMIALAEQTRRRQGKENVTFVLADIESWPLPDAAYDFIVSTYTLHHTDMALILPRLRRALKPGGQIFVRDLVCNDGERWRNSNRYHIQRVLKELAPLVRRHGVQAAWRIMQLRLNPTWIRHLRADHVFSVPITEQLYKDQLPGSIFMVNQEEYSVLWNAPPSTEAKPTVAIPAHTRELLPIAELPWHQDHWENERFAKADIERSVVEIFERQVAQSSQTTAIKMGERSLTYAQLNAQVNQVARTLIAERGDQAEPIALFFTDPVDTIIALLAVLKAGKLYLVLNPVQPAATLARICRDAGVALLIAPTAHLATIKEWTTDWLLLNFDEVAATLSTDNLQLPLTADHLSGIYYTSGSTGAPKGIVRDHRQLLHSTWHNSNAYQITSVDRHSLLYSPALTAAVPDMLDPLLNGATLYPFDPKANPVNALIEWLQREEITLLHLPVVLFRRLLDALQNGESLNTEPQLTFPKLRLVILAGQSIYKPDVERFRRLFAPAGQILFRLAMTEAGSVTHLVLNHQSELGDVIPVGYPTADKTILLLDENHQAVPAGETGQVAIRSRYLSVGYWQDPTLTASKFLIDPTDASQRIYLSGDQGRWQADGTLEYLGRQDNMVKIRGYRVELGAIETALLNLEAVKESVVVTREDADGNKQLIGYIVPRTTGLTANRVRHLLSQTLPEYMIPSHFVLLAALPQTLNGKVDYQVLPPPGHERPELDIPYVAPRNPTEAQLAVLWEEFFEIHPIGVQDDFFALGGNSITLLKLATRLKQQFGQEVSLKLFLQDSTIEKLAQLLNPSSANNGSQMGEQAHSDIAQLSEADAKQIAPFLLGQQGAVQPPLVQPRLRDHWIPYGVYVRFFQQVGRIPLIQTRLFPQESQLLRRFLPLMGVKPQQINEEIATYLMRSLCKRHCRTLLAHTLWRNMQQVVVLSGQNFLAEAQQNGRGILLLNTHSFTTSYTLSIVLQQLGYNNFMVHKGKAGLPNRPALRKAFQQYFATTQDELVITKLLSLQMEMARQKLKAGGIVWIAPDGRSGQLTLSLPVFGRERAFSTGFADLSIETGAVAIPTRCVTLPTGKIQVTFLPPLDSGAGDAPRQERIVSLVQQYVAFLEETWKLDPANITFRHIKFYLED